MTTVKKAPKQASVDTPETFDDEWRIGYHPTCPVVTLNYNQIIHDAEFNYTRQRRMQCSPFDLDRDSPGEADSLKGKIGEGTPVDFAIYDPIARFATEAEKARWLELHINDEWFQAIPEKDRDKHIPNQIILDGFGRAEDAWERNGQEFGVEFKLLDTADQHVAMWLAVILNTTQRQPSPFDLADTLKAMQDHFGWNRTELSHRIRKSKPQVTQIMKCHQLNLEEKSKAISEGWSLLRIRQYVDRKKGLTVAKGAEQRPKVMRGKTRGAIKENLNAFIEGGVIKEGSTADAFLRGFLACLEYEDGDYRSSDSIEDILEMGGIDVNSLPNDVTSLPEKEKDSKPVQPQDPNKGKKTIAKKSKAS